MERISPPGREQLAEFEAGLEEVEALAGYVPNSMPLMARRPELLRGFMSLSRAVFAPGGVEHRLKGLVAFVASTAAGCRYCQAHTGSAAHGAGVEVEKLRAAFEFDWSPLFSARERAALRLAAAAGSAPSAVTDAHFAELKQHFSEDEICELVGVIALFGFLNRWNDTLGTPLEPVPLRFAREQLGPSGWEPGVHGG